MPPAAAPPGQGALEIERIKQYPGLQQVQRAVVVNVPGKYFPQLQAAEQKVDYSGTRYGRRVPGAPQVRSACEGVGRRSGGTGGRCVCGAGA